MDNGVPVVPPETVVWWQKVVMVSSFRFTSRETEREPPLKRDGEFRDQGIFGRHLSFNAVVFTGAEVDFHKICISFL